MECAPRPNFLQHEIIPRLLKTFWNRLSQELSWTYSQLLHADWKKYGFRAYLSLKRLYLFFSLLKPVIFWHLTTWRPKSRWLLFNEIGERSSVIVRFTEHTILFSLLLSSFSPQILLGFVGFLFPKLPDGLRAAYLKVHVFFGVFIFMMAIGSCLLGVNEKLSFNPKWVLVNWQF